MSDALKYGPSVPEDHHVYKGFSTPVYMRGYARKIIKDLEKTARMYNGKQIRIYKLTGTQRCVHCTNEITGEILLSNCKECGGTGVVDSWECLGDYWAYVDFGGERHVATDTGLTNNPGGEKDKFVIIGAPILEDRDFFVVVETKKAFKIYNVEPDIIAMAGTVVAQSAQAANIEIGSPEYRVVNW